MKQKTDNIQKVTIELKTKVIVLSLEPLDTDTNMDDFCKIQYHNIMGEILTCSVALNRVGNMLAEMDEILAESKLDFEIFYAQQQEKQRKSLTFQIDLPKGGTKVDKPTKDEVENAVMLTPEYKVKKLNLIKLQKNQSIINSWYWSIKSKDSKLEKISEKLQPTEFEKDILEGKINGVMLKKVNKEIA
jgi:hypothetical protein